MAMPQVTRNSAATISQGRAGGRSVGSLRSRPPPRARAYSISRVMGQWSEPWTPGMMPAVLMRPRSSSETKK